jgi:predicted DNA-binding transcriptional regulator AlpA
MNTDVNDVVLPQKAGKHERLVKALNLFDDLPDSALADEDVLCAVSGWSRSAVWRGVAMGTIPKPVKLGPRSNRWRVGAIRSLIHAQRSEGEGA